MSSLYTLYKQLNNVHVGREPWCSGYEWRLMFKRVWVWVPALYTGWTFFTLICCKNCIVCLKRPKINEKDAGVGPFKKQCTHLGSCLPIASKLERLECCSDPETATRRWVGHCSNRNWLLATNNSPEKEERNCDGIRTQALGNLRPFTTDE